MKRSDRIDFYNGLLVARPSESAQQQRQVRKIDIAIAVKCLPGRYQACIIQSMAHDGAFNSAQETDAVYSGGVLKPLQQLDLHEQERVHIVVHTLKQPSETERKAALARLFANIEKMNFRHGGPYPTRDELHERR